MTTTLFYVLVDFKSKHGEYPVVSKVSVIQKTQLEFPAVTVCNQGIYSMKNVTVTEALRLYMRKTTQQKDYFKHVKINWTSPEFVALDNENMTLWHDKASFQLADVIIFGKWESVFLLDHYKLLEITETTMGRCFTFNGNNSYTAAFPGVASGLALSINVDEANYAPTNSLSAGISVYLHEPGQPPESVEATFVAPGTEAFISMDRIQYKMLPEPFKSADGKCCLDTDAATYVNPLKYFKMYSPYNCWIEDFYEKIHNKCNCCQPGLEDFWKLKACSRRQMLECFLEEKGKVWYNGVMQDFQTLDCPIRCKYTIYEPSISTLQYPSTSTAETYLEKIETLYNTTDDLRKNLIYLHVFYSNMLVQQIDYEAKYQWDSIIVSLGGFMGLFIGASLLSCIEIFELLLNIVGLCLLNRKGEKNAAQNSSASHND